MKSTSVPFSMCSQQPKATFILLSFARPKNIQRIINSIKQSESFGWIVLSNNQPKVNLIEYLSGDNTGVSIINQKSVMPPIIRMEIARNTDADYFIFIDDDIFLQPRQIDGLLGKLIDDPTRPHGIIGEKHQIVENKLRVQTGFQNTDSEVTVINSVYACTKKHILRFFEIFAKLGYGKPTDLRFGDDIILSASGEKSPLIHDLGPIHICATYNHPEIAQWKKTDFNEHRFRLEMNILRERVAGARHYPLPSPHTR